jgi:hypothetical protein
MSFETDLIAMLGGDDAMPALTSEELAQCLTGAAIPDSAGLPPADPHWEPSYDMNRAASSGWVLKAGKVAADYTITIEGRELNRAQMIDNFLKLSKQYIGMAQPRYTSPPNVLPDWRV